MGARIGHHTPTFRPRVPEAERRGAAAGHGFMRSLMKRLGGQEAGLLVVTLVLGATVALFSTPVISRDPDTGKLYKVNRFLQPENLDRLAKDTSFFAIMAVGATFIIISGGIDLSVGSVYCLSAVCGALFLRRYGAGGPGADASPLLVVPAAMAICIGVGTLCGLANGLMVVYLRVHPFIITLGTMAILRGVALRVTEAQSITGLSPAFTDGFIRQGFGTRLYPVPFFFMLLVTIGGGLLLHKTAVGRRIYAIGGNETAGRFSGVRVNLVKLFVYVAGGLTAGVAGMIMIGYYGSAASSTGEGYELEVIAAAVVGGASLTGGRGTALGAMLGALIIRMIDNAIVILGFDQNNRRIIIGAVIILTVLLDQTSSWLRRRGESARSQAGAA